MNLALSKEISAFERLLPSIRSAFGSVWVVMVDGGVKANFGEFGKAALFAIANYPDRQFLIRHTAATQAELPFIAVDGLSDS